MACGLDMMRINVHSGAMVTDQGIIEGDAARTLRARKLLAAEVAMLADINVKHAAPVASASDIRDAARDAAYRGLADGLIVTGSATGHPCSAADLMAVRGAVPDRPLFVGSGVSAETVRETLLHADGVIVGTWIKKQGRVGNPVDSSRAREFVEEARRQ
jgi:membrane complex biogenesis BtpA family protein